MGIIEFISPKWAFIRESWRSAFKMQRNYDAGLYDRRNRNWRAHNESAEFTDRRSERDHGIWNETRI